MISPSQFIGWLCESPHVLLILLLLGGATIGTWKLLNQMTMPAFLSSPKTSLLLLVGLFMVTMRGYNTNQRLLGLNSDLANAEWRIRQGWVQQSLPPSLCCSGPSTGSISSTR